MVISASLQACGVVFPFAMLTSICRSIVTICSGLYLLIGMTRFSSKWILSHSTWYKFRRSGQPAAKLVGSRRGEVERQRAHQQLVEHYAQRIDVGASVQSQWYIGHQIDQALPDGHLERRSEFPFCWPAFGRSKESTVRRCSSHCC